jgi:hypothetical protein
MTSKRDDDLKREIESDLELEEEEQRERGLSAKEAHYAALRAFGNPVVIREQTGVLRLYKTGHTALKIWRRGVGSSST